MRVTIERVHPWLAGLRRAVLGFLALGVLGFDASAVDGSHEPADWVALPVISSEAPPQTDEVAARVHSDFISHPVFYASLYRFLEENQRMKNLTQIQSQPSHRKSKKMLESLLIPATRQE